MILEQRIAQTATSGRPENNAADRLELITEFLVELSNQRSGVVQPLQALILEDFFITGAQNNNSTRPGVPAVWRTLS